MKGADVANGELTFPHAEFFVLFFFTAVLEAQDAAAYSLSNSPI